MHQVFSGGAVVSPTIGSMAGVQLTGTYEPAPSMLSHGKTF